MPTYAGIGELLGPVRHPTVDATLRTVTVLTGMELAFLGRLDDDTFTFTRVAARGGAVSWPGIDEGVSMAAADSLCQRMLLGAPSATADAPHDEAYAGASVVGRHGITSYVGVPVLAPDGSVYGTLCGMDRSGISVTDDVIAVLSTLAGVVTARLGDSSTPAVVRTNTGWRVTGAGEDSADAEDLTSAMVLADLLSAELGPAPHGNRPGRGDEPVDEVGRLRLSVQQLEHALAARVVVEQAIGVVAERRHTAPRTAFETLRSVARGSGRRVHDLARDVVSSATGAGTSTPLPSSLARAGAVPSPAAVARVVHAHAAPRPGPSAH